MKLGWETASVQQFILFCTDEDTKNCSAEMNIIDFLLFIDLERFLRDTIML